jgi:hypothetical protein
MAAACGTSPAPSEAAAPTPVAAGTPWPGSAGGGPPALGSEINETARLALGTLRLEGALTPDATQASQLVFLWQAYGSLVDSGSSAAAEVESVVAQILGAMTAEQLAAIEAMAFDADEVSALVQELRQQATEGEARSGQAFGPGGGFMPPGGGPGAGVFGGGQGGGFPGADSGLSPEQIATAQANRAQRQVNGDMLTRLLLTPLLQRLETLAGS